MLYGAISHTGRIDGSYYGEVGNDIGERKFVDEAVGWIAVFARNASPVKNDEAFCHNSYTDPLTDVS